MHAVLGLLASFGLAASAAVIPRAEQTAGREVVPAYYDGQCFYPVPDPSFVLEEYLGTWYQVAGTPFGETSGAKCVTAEYQANDDGTVKVINTATAGGRSVGANGTAAPVSAQYGFGGAFVVSFPESSPAECPGPNYIVQEYGGDYAIVQTQEWGVLYILSRERQPGQEQIDAWIQRAVCLGSNATVISMFDQEGC
ncbi:Calycin-like protein [Aaosphaeria arxii CBS 175.79]|uniref:Calycin-like protein n=1 Tax=Aaosphaeria arxii CBS 175.79 TaxID=1450172 RepID=A0A6A5XDG4_9PLEO|nr:Calycin-like protein [Aaosphaeria arxii CBS 175.79]KAF2011038.1 Calycin-like protein [Aaosphaeria arxii CBS 175.79]